MINPTNQFTTQSNPYSSSIPPILQRPSSPIPGTETYTTTHKTTTAQTLLNQPPSNNYQYTTTNPSISTINNKNMQAIIPPIKNITSIQSITTSPLISSPKQFYHPTIVETQRTLLGASPVSTFQQLPRPLSPLNHPSIYPNRNQRCVGCCPCFRTQAQFGIPPTPNILSNPIPNYGYPGMKRGMCQNLCGGSQMMGGCCGSTYGTGCCPFGRQNRGIQMGMGTPPMLGGFAGSNINYNSIGNINTPGLGMQREMGLGLGGRHIGMGGNLMGGGSECCFCPECAAPNGCCACLSTANCCYPCCMC